MTFFHLNINTCFCSYVYYITGGTVHWELYEEPTDPVVHRFTPQARSSNIETTAYALLIHAATEDIHTGLDIVKWVVRQRNSRGGFGSTQVGCVLAIH